MKNSFTLLFYLAIFAFTSKSIAQVTYSQDFEGAGVSLPTGWTQTSNASDGGFIRGNAASLSSNAFPFAAHTTFIATNDDGCGSSCNKSNDFVVSPSIDLSGVSNPYLKVDIFYYEGTFSGATETAFIEASTDNGTTWTVISDLGGVIGGWQTVFVNLNAYANTSSLKIGFRYKDNGGWLYGLGIDDFSIYTPPASSVDLNSLNLNDFVLQTGVDISGTLFNTGTLPLTSVTLSYSIAGGAPVSQTINGLNIAPFTTSDVIHPTQWIPADLVNYAVALTVSNPNGATDPDLTNNTKSKTVTVASQSVQRLPLIEEFTSSTCPPCASFNNTFNPLLDDLEANVGPNAQVAIVKSQLDFPAPGNDPSYNADAENRRAYYGVNGIPDPFLDGVSLPANSGFIQLSVDRRREDAAFLSIVVDAKNNGDSLIADVIVTPYANFPSGYKLYIAVTEDRYEYEGTNTETEFHHVLRKMLPGGSGISLTGLTANTPSTYSRKYKFGFNLDNTTQNTFNLWGEDFSGVTVVAWIQNTSTKEVFQAAFDETVTSVTVINEDEKALDARFYPNPSNETTFMKVNVPADSKVNLEVFNIMGQRVGAQDFGTQNGVQTLKYDTSDLTNGVYLFNLTVGNTKVTRKVSINH